MNGLPAGWAETTVGEVAETKLGKMLSAKSKVGTNPRPYLRNKNVQWGRIDVDDLLRMDFSDEEFEVFQVRHGDLLVCEGGEIGRAAIWRDPQREVAFQKALHRVRPRDEVQTEFLLYLFMWLGESNGFDRFVTGSTIKHLPQEDLRRLPLPLPPLAEQRRIVAAIEEQFSRLDAAESVLAKALRRLESLRKATIVSSIPDHLGDGWTLSTVGAVGTLQLGRQRAPKYHHGSNMKPYLRVANVFEDRIVTSDVKEMHFSPDEFKRYRLEEGDVLLNEGQTPELVGRPAIYRGEPADVGFTNSLLRFKPSNDVDTKYALLVFRRHLHSGRFMREARITTNIAHLSAGRLKTVEFNYPAIDEQRRIVAEVERQLSLIDSLRAAVESAQKRSGALRRAILERAFRGELVPQDPDDEPASVLLERIRAERAAAPKPARRKRVAT